ncbi:hypothetical protein SAMD00019534_043640 [Acytostelium subglobosum LB1]|uniref:hypothetical protein n=1 Tax=Acytostelium subglobosum LB1 TaxID=1410327 RepID=UPI000644B624|nr:hypothetical protein SAMD00019534_043640 [Acytostelium subglobosum LB1]GAM21189.1 hypothetical protein SAMD00019534_043640 [Acytostelium subglobosum LB1]|eukprot:XP_012756323.1 hypothetical protein SAMD00019534_043640 [Acytostelium subglobosum LB1]
MEDSQHFVYVRVPPMTIEEIASTGDKDQEVQQLADLVNRYRAYTRSEHITGTPLESSLAHSIVCKLIACRDINPNPTTSFLFSFLSTSVAKDIVWTLPLVDLSTAKRFPIFVRRTGPKIQDNVQGLDSFLTIDANSSTEPDIQFSLDSFGLVIKRCSPFILYRTGPKSLSSDFYVKLSDHVVLAFIVKLSITTNQLLDELKKLVIPSTNALENLFSKPLWLSITTFLNVANLPPPSACSHGSAPYQWLDDQTYDEAITTDEDDGDDMDYSQ